MRAGGRENAPYDEDLRTADRELAARGHEQVQAELAASPPPRRRRGRSSSPAGTPPTLSPQEHAFVEAYLRTGNATQAAKLVGYHAPSRSGRLLMRSSRIRAALAAAHASQGARQVDAATLSRAFVIEKHLEIINGPNVFAKIKSLEQLAKLQGYFAPIKHEKVERDGNPYAQLVETLRAGRTAFTAEEQAQMRARLYEDLRDLQEALRLLGGEKVN